MTDGNANLNDIHSEPFWGFGIRCEETDFTTRKTTEVSLYVQGLIKGAFGTPFVEMWTGGADRRIYLPMYAYLDFVKFDIQLRDKILALVSKKPESVKRAKNVRIDPYRSQLIVDFTDDSSVGISTIWLAPIRREIKGTDRLELSEDSTQILLNGQPVLSIEKFLEHAGLKKIGPYPE